MFDNLSIATFYFGFLDFSILKQSQIKRIKLCMAA